MADSWGWSGPGGLRRHRPDDQFVDDAAQRHDRDREQQHHRVRGGEIRIDLRVAVVVFGGRHAFSGFGAHHQPSRNQSPRRKYFGKQQLHSTILSNA